VVEGDGDRVNREETDEVRSGSVDPLEEQTQPLIETGGGESKDPSIADTTTWAGSQTPPARIEPRPAEPELQTETEPETVVEAAAAFEPQPESESEPEIEPEPELDDATDPVVPVDADATVVAAPTVTDPVSRTPIAPSASLHPMLLERIEPSLGRGERMRLDAAHWRVSLGRGEQNDIRLYTASASREHALIAGNEAGEWILTPAVGKAVRIDGDETSEPVVLEVGMNLILGGDHLRCVTEGLERSQMAAKTSADLFDEDGGKKAGIGATWWLIGGVALLGLALLAYAWMSS